ncbi:hypothetical protein LPJ56_003651 [Coemansia sp. RSA 2599]|nr:hypothetical protein LPJ75_003422 [Coemansia sp. RSA 2598]KAJ1819413.1 hypothetical protein LPJ56_003651 [Coemansia sp. RSA 2599]
MDLDGIERRESLGVDEFVRDFLEPNIPVVLGPSFTASWPARHDWVAASGSPNYARLLELYSDAQVQVAECDKVYFSDQQRTAMSFSEFVAKWRHAPEAKMYCKDWHFTRSNPAYKAYAPLAHLSDDWINMYYDSKPELNDDYRFCYMGGDGTWTPFHEDVYRSYSWSANICGRKRWIMVPPGQSHLFTDGLGNWVYNLLDYDKAKYPRLSELKTLEIIQGPGETVFVPAGWWHQVLNIGDTISINHNWGNEFNLSAMYDRLQTDLANVRHALRDVTDMDDFDDYVQMVLKADSGTNHREFFGFIEAIADIYIKRAQNMPGAEPMDAFDPYFRSPKSMSNAMRRISATLQRMLEDPGTRSVGGLSGSVAQLLARLPAFDDATASVVAGNKPI